MCGILIFESCKEGIDVRQTKTALSLQNHRGPDNQSLSYWRNSNGTGSLRKVEDTNHAEKHSDIKLAIGHNRLSIIDLNERSNQPMFSEDNSYAITFNGEIYNYQELRKELESSGEVFRTESDTEVLLKSLIKWGPKITKRLNGMWAFAFLDIKRKKIVLSRDRYGQKPLYYHFDSEQFIAASEIKSIYALLSNKERKIHADHLKSFISYNFWPTNDNGETMYSGISFLQPGQCLIFDIEKHTIATNNNNNINRFIESSVTPQQLSHDINSAVQLRLRADVPVAILLSGGVDSSIIASYACNNRSDRNNITFYTGNTSYGNDLKYSRLAAKSLNIPLKEIDIPYNNEILQVANQLTKQYDLPVPLFGNSIAMSQMFKAMSSDGIRVVLDGTGGDEIFGGYFDFYGLSMLDALIDQEKHHELFSFISSCLFFKQIPAIRLLNHLRNRLLSSQENGSRRKNNIMKHALSILIKTCNLTQKKQEYFRPLSYYAAKNSPQGFSDKETPSPLGKNANSLLEKQMHDTVKGRLPNWLCQNDHNSMMHSVETRSPFLDYKLIKYFSLPPTEKFHKGFNKFALRQASHHKLSSKVLSRRDKQGFRWWAPAFYESNKKNIIENLAESHLLNQVYRLDDIIKDIKVNTKIIHPVNVLRLFSIALLENNYPCTI